ncbi:Nucleoid-associated protein YbaB [Baekduia alba]|uniref:YbaB/EbfC family nucleoid-associated protein n=1 Tax=Baekduia alba TaxID=2997333 RepID=UPI00233F8411|nr:YbaB/EbfC family nucleoid-associated protein [Baekduia alba]WCB92326.1 Nucleoid-associated protein YbaB [Baekduia alba]
MPQPNIQNMLKQAQEVMAAQQEAQDALKEQKVESSAGGGMVKVVVSGDLKLESLTIDPDAVDPEDVEMLQDLVLAATNEALRQAVELQEKAMQAASGPGGFDPMQALEGLGLGDALGGLGGGGAAGGLPAGGGGAPGMNRAARRAAAKKNR